MVFLQQQKRKNKSNFESWKILNFNNYVIYYAYADCIMHAHVKFERKK